MRCAVGLSHKSPQTQKRGRSVKTYNNTIKNNKTARQAVQAGSIHLSTDGEGYALVRHDASSKANNLAAETTEVVPPRSWIRKGTKKSRHPLTLMIFDEHHTQKVQQTSLQQVSVQGQRASKSRYASTPSYELCQYLAISPVVPVWLVGIYPVLVRW